MDSLPQHLEPTVAYRALSTRDGRFDGRLFVGVTSTGIYCRPICRVKLPQARNCRFFAHAAAAELAGFRPCLRCRPELAPGWSRADACQTLAHQGARLIECSVAQGEPTTVTALAARLGVSDRHLRRIFSDVLGVSPLDWLNTHRLLLAKRLLMDTPMPLAELALACGFRSLRQFHAAFHTHYRLTPGALRRTKNLVSPGHTTASTASNLTLPFRLPYATAAMRTYWHTRAIASLEHWRGDVATRSLNIHQAGRWHQGVLRWQLDDACAHVKVAISPGLLPVIATVLQRVRHALDLDTDTLAIDHSLSPLPGPPGVRLPTCFDPFEAVVRIILGQQVSVAWANTLATRLVMHCGTPLNPQELAFSEGTVSHCFPTPEQVLGSRDDALGALGIFSARVRALKAVAKHCLDTTPAHWLNPATFAGNPEVPLPGLAGLGPWSQAMVAMRVLGWPDAFPAGDAAVLKALQVKRAQDASTAAQPWRPWRAYATTRLWLQPDVTLPNQGATHPDEDVL